ncbi:hypothetical protein [Lysinibacter cavernae]|uniref:Uncharacterized protein n=1 Tax=Lysinibacter cavernae TaxID=1640652 RepID=A0A7X5R0J9_9MICO|nr:hypothetical protein [Lysinibacter cavernae]
MRSKQTLLMRQLSGPSAFEFFLKLLRDSISVCSPSLGDVDSFHGASANRNCHDQTNAGLSASAGADSASIYLTDVLPRWGDAVQGFGDGTTRYHTVGKRHTVGYTAVGSLKTYRSVNNTLGQFCTYAANKTMTNILSPQTSGVIANQVTVYVKKC